MTRLFLFAALLCLAAPAFAAAPPAKLQPASGSAPSFRFQTLEGEESSLDPFYGQKVLIVNFWATWCPPCVKEMPSLDKLAGLLPKDKYRVTAIAIQTEKAEVSGYFKRANIKNLSPYIDPSMTSTRAFGLRGLPATVIIDSGGRIVGRVDGDIDWTAPDVVEWLKGIS